MGVKKASCTYPQRPELSPGEDLVTQGANPRVVALGAPRTNSHSNRPHGIGSVSDHIID